jgi:tellurite resistance-related uncharacterized protein
VLESLSLPDDVSLVRTTPELTVETVPVGLLSAHRIAPGVWGVLRVRRGALIFVVERTGDSRRVMAGELQVVEPDVAHHVELEPDTCFVVEFYR